MKRGVAIVNGQHVELPRHVDMRGMLQFLILWELRDGPLHGREIARRIGTRRGDAPNPGTLYPALQDLTGAGLLSREEEGRRVTYALTEAGREEVRAAATFFRAAYRDIVEDAPGLPGGVGGGYPGP